MATMSNLSRLLRTTFSHRNATTLLHHTPPTSFLHSHTFNFSISEPHLSSSFLSRCVRTRATTLQNPQNPLSISKPSSLLILNPHLSSTFISKQVHTRATILQRPRSPYSISHYALTLGCIATGGMIVFYKFQEETLAPKLSASVNDELEFRFQGSVPHMYHKGHSVVVEGLFLPCTDNIDSNAADENVETKRRGWEFNLSATEVLSQPQEVAAALEWNHNFFTEKLKALDDMEQYVLDDEKCIPEEEKQKDTVDWYATSSDEISESKGSVDQFAKKPELVYPMTDVLKDILDIFEDIPDLLRDGHSIFIKGFIKRITDGTIEDKLDEVNENKLEVMKDNKSDVMMKEDEHDTREDDQSLEDKSDEIKENKSNEIKINESDELKVNELDEMKEDKLDEIKGDKWTKSVTGKTKELDYHFSAEAGAKHDELFMPQEVAAAIG